MDVQPPAGWGGRGGAGGGDRIDGSLPRARRTCCISTLSNTWFEIRESQGPFRRSSVKMCLMSLPRTRGSRRFQTLTNASVETPQTFRVPREIQQKNGVMSLPRGPVGLFLSRPHQRMGQHRTTPTGPSGSITTHLFEDSAGAKKLHDGSL